jgi:hypothetical protein
VFLRYHFDQISLDFFARAGVDFVALLDLVSKQVRCLLFGSGSFRILRYSGIREIYGPRQEFERNICSLFK